MDELDELLSPDSTPVPESRWTVPTPESRVPVTPFELTPKHYQRLRFYWTRRGRATAHYDNVDLQLIGMGYVARVPSTYSTDSIRITVDGERALAAEHRVLVANRRPHHDLSGRLAAWLRSQGRVTWENIECRVERSNIEQRVSSLGLDPLDVSSHVRPDVFSMAAVTNPDRMNPAVHEIKVSRGDFMADVSQPLKRLAYASFSEVIYYVCPEGLVQKEEVPADCGLVVELACGQFEVRKRAKRSPVQLGPGSMMNLLLKRGQLNALS